MHLVQECLDFPIDTPSNAELFKRFDELKQREEAIAKKRALPKKRNRKSNKQKRIDRINREA